MQANMKLKSDKCVMAQTELEYLGHYIGPSGIRPNDKKCAVVRSYPQPKNVREVRQFLGMATYYKKFIKDFAQKSAPLYKLTRPSSRFEWNEECENAFQSLKQALTSPPILRYPDYSKPFFLVTDASTEALSCILSQKDDENREYVICYGGRALKDREKRYHICELELLSIVYGLSYYKHILYSAKIYVVTDCRALQFLKTAPIKGRIARWGFILASHDYSVIYRPGKLNASADALSRRPYPPYRENDEDAALEDNPNMPFMGANLHPPVDTILDQVKLAAEQKVDPNYRDIIEYIQTKSLPDSDSAARRVIISSDLYHVDPRGVLYHTPTTEHSKRLDVGLQIAVPQNRIREILYA